MALALRVLLGVALSLPAFAGPDRPATEQGAGDKPAALLAEFPPYDASLFSLQKGLTSKQADRQVRDDPFAPETVRLLAAAGRENDVLQASGEIFDKYPGRIAATLEAVSQLAPPSEDVPGRNDRLQAVIDHARRRMQVLDSPARAEAALALLKAEASVLRGVPRSRDWYRTRLEAIRKEYAGTDTALEIEVDLIGNSSRRDLLEEIAQYETFSKAHPGTRAGAKALYLAAFQLAVNVPVTGVEQRGSDPTERVLRVFEQAAQLEKDGAFPRCEWTDKATDLVMRVFISKDATYASENIRKLLAAHSSFVVSHWKLDDIWPDRNGIGYLLTSKVFDLYKAKGEGVAGFERFLEELEGRVADRFGVRYLRAQFYARQMVSEEPAAKSKWLEKASRTLATIAEEQDGFYARKALATLAALAFQQGEFTAARELFTKYVSSYPDSPYSWVASLRIGQCDQARGEWARAVSAYEAVRATGDLAPVAHVLAGVLAGRGYEALGDPEKALALFRRALGDWDPAFGESYSVGGPPTNRPIGLRPWGMDAEYRATHLGLEARVALLERTTASAGAAPLEQARAMLKTGRWQEAARLAEKVVSQYRSSPNAVEAKYLSHRALLEETLERADVEAARSDPKGVLAGLQRLSKEPFDFAVCVADIARAYLASGGGASPQGEKLLLQALSNWRKVQHPAAALTPLEKDVEAVRSLVFHPNGDSIYAGTRWNGFAWPAQPKPFVVTAREVRVKTADGQARLLSFVQRIPHLDNVLFADEDQLSLLNTFMVRLGGTKSRQGQIFFDKGYMETPNQPLGPSLTVMAFLDKGFHVMPGHWGGWHFITFPAIRELVFLDEPRTRAIARVRVGYGGGDVLLEKPDGSWKVTKLTSTWVE